MPAFIAKEFGKNPTLEQLTEPIMKDDWRFFAQSLEISDSPERPERSVLVL